MSKQIAAEFIGDAAESQAPYACAVVIPTVLRPELRRALESVYAQRNVGRRLIMIGVDKSGETWPETAYGDPAAHGCALLVMRLPYSTSVRHGGMHSAGDGGSLRAALSLLANSRYCAYLDDDNEWEPDHLALSLAAIQDKAWCFAQRLLVDDDTGAALAIDTWDSVGPGRGRFASVGGFVDPNCLVVDKTQVLTRLPLWSETPSGALGMNADRNFFRAISALPHGRVEQATVRYRVRPNNILRRFIRDGARF